MAPSHLEDSPQKQPKQQQNSQQAKQREASNTDFNGRGGRDGGNAFVSGLYNLSKEEKDRIKSTQGGLLCQKVGSIGRDCPSYAPVNELAATGCPPP